MSTTTISGTINGVNNAALANKWITFRLVQLGTDSGATATIAQSVDSVQTDANGNFSIDVWNNGDSGKTSVLEITIDGSKAENVIIPTGTASIELWDLIENYQSDGGTSEQVPVVSALFVRKSNNLSDLGSASTSRANLGVAIGTDVQAHSAVLDATTESFTVARDTAITTNTANIASNDADIGVLTGSVLQNQTDISSAESAILNNTIALNDKAPIDNPTFTGTINTSATGIDFDPGTVGGELSWNDTEKTLDLATGSDGVTLQLGQEVVLYVRNTTGVTLSDGQVVTISGSQGNKPTVALAQADTVENARKTIGVVTQTILDNSDGFVTLIGKVRGLVLDVGTYTEGDKVYLSSTVAGGITVVEPDIGVEIGHVLATSTGGNTSGVLEVQVHNGAAVHELEQDVIANANSISGNTSAILNNTIAINDKIPNASTTGTANATTFLRGDNTWSSPEGSSTAAAYPYTSYIRSNTFYAKNFKTITNLDIFNGDLTLSSIYIGGNCVTIDEYAFDGCTNLEDLTLAEGVTTLGSSSFASCTSLESPSFPNSLQTIGDNSFYNCSLITSVDTGTGVSFVDTRAFADCIGLQSAILGNSVVNTGQSVFNGCTSLTSITLGNSVELIGNNFANGATLLTSINIPDSVNNIGFDALLGTGIAFTTDDGSDYLSSPSYSFLFNGNPSATGTVTIPENINGKTVRVIAGRAFSGNANITGLSIPSGVIRIGESAFSFCTSLSSISCFATVAPDLGNSAFNNVSATTIDVPVGATGYGVTYGGLTVNYVL